MKKYLYLLYFLVIIICLYLIKNHQSGGIGDIAPLIYIILILISFVAIIFTFFFQSPSGLLKNIVLSLTVGIALVVLIIAAILYFDEKKQTKDSNEYIARVERQKEFYRSLKVLEEFSVVMNRNPDDKITSITASTYILKDTTLQNWKMKMVVFVKPKRNKLLLDLTLFESEEVSLTFSTTQKIESPIIAEPYKLRSFMESVGDQVDIEYMLLFMSPSPYSKKERGLDKGFAYTSLSESEIEEWNGTVSVFQSRKYALVHSKLLPQGQQLHVSDLAIDLNEN